MIAGAVGTVVALGAAGAVGLTALQEAPGDEELIDRLVALESDVPPLPPSDVVIDPEQTWAEFEGDFTGANVALDTIADEARALYIDAEEGSTPVAAAVADVARSLLVMRQGYASLAEWETHDLAFPLDAADDAGVSAGADELYGEAEVGLTLLLEARARALPAYAVLRDAEAADDSERTLLEQRYRDAVAFDATLRPRLHLALSLEPTQVMVTASRFVTSAPGIEPRARVMQVICIDREAYLAAEEPAEVDALVAALDAAGDTAEDCPALDNGNEVRLVGR
jgi:hypothetical protein